MRRGSRDIMVQVAMHCCGGKGAESLLTVMCWARLLEPHTLADAARGGFREVVFVQSVGALLILLA